jgi:hypothetical protein
MPLCVRTLSSHTMEGEQPNSEAAAIIGANSAAGGAVMAAVKQASVNDTAMHMRQQRS